jgi:glycosyltransferase involved in cell wall biosynthesis
MRTSWSGSVGEGFDVRAMLARAQTDLDLHKARVAGLEALIGKAEELGRHSLASFAELLGELGLAVNVEDLPPSGIPDLVALLREYLVQARHRYGTQLDEIRELSGQVEALEKEKRLLGSRLRIIEGELSERRREEATRGRLTGSARLRILMALHDFLPRHRGGVEIYSWRIAKALASRHDLHLFFTEAHPSVPSYQAREGTFDGLPFTEISHQHVPAFFEDSWRDPRMESHFGAVLDRFEPDLVHVQHLGNLSLGVIGMAKSLGLPVVYTLHDYALLCPRGGKMLRQDFSRCEQPRPERCAECIGEVPLRTWHSDEDSLIGWFVPEGLRRLLGDAVSVAKRTSSEQERQAAVEARLAAVKDALAMVDLVIAPSEWLRRTFVGAGVIAPDRIVVSEPGHEPLASEPRHDPGPRRFRVGYLGAIVPAKGVHVLVEAMNLLTDVPGVEGVIHGFTDADPQYARAIKLGCKNPRVRFAGAFEPDEVPRILADMDVLVVPSLWWENAPLAIQEAFLAGVPVVVSDIGGMAEKVIDGVTGVHFRVGDARDLAARLKDLHADRLRLFRLAASRPAIRTIAEDAWDLERRYRQLVDSSTPGYGPR